MKNSKERIFFNGVNKKWNQNEGVHENGKVGNVKKKRDEKETGPAMKKRSH